MKIVHKLLVCLLVIRVLIHVRRVFALLQDERVQGVILLYIWNACAASLQP